MTTAGSSRAFVAPGAGAGARTRTARTFPTATALFSASFNVMSSAKIDDESCHRLAPPESAARFVPRSRTIRSAFPYVGREESPRSVEAWAGWSFSGTKTARAFPSARSDLRF